MNDWLKNTIRSFSSLHLKGDEKNVLIFSTPRSGSTWLMELIATQPKFRIANEPLNIRRKEISTSLGIDNWDDLYSPAHEARVLEYFGEIAKGKYRFMGASPIRKQYRPITRRIAYKVINGAEQMVDKIAEVTNSTVLVLIRHPFSVSLSRKVLPRLDILTSPQLMKGCSEEQKKLAIEIRDGKSSFMQKAVLSWCIQNKLVLDIQKPNWMVFTYEQLITDPRPIINAIQTGLDLTDPDEMFQRLSIPSAVTVQSEQGTAEHIQSDKRNNLISKWEKSIDQPEANQLWEIVDAFGLAIYDKQTSLPLDEYSIQ